MKNMTMNNEYKCPACGTSDFQIENGYYVCQICGHQEAIPQKNVEWPSHKKEPSAFNKYLNIGIRIGIFGIFLFLGIVFVGLIEYGEVYLYNGYEFTAYLTTISLVCMHVGLCCAVVKKIIEKKNK